MARFFEGVSRDQTTRFPERSEDRIGEDSLVRVVDLFVDQLDVAGLGFVKKDEGCKLCRRSGKGGFCRLYDLPLEMALDLEVPWTFERDGFDAAD